MPRPRDHVAVLKKRALRSVAIAVLASAATVGPPDPGSGVIDGRVAAMFWPSRGTGANGTEFLDAEGCRAHLVPATDLDVERTYPCGRWFRPAAGTFKAWLEGKDYISAFPTTFRYRDEPFTGRGFVGVIPVVPAGRVRLADDVPLPAGRSMRLIALDERRAGTWQRAFDRRVHQRASVQLPAGNALAALVERNSGDAVALSRPFRVRAGEAMEVRPIPPANDADVLVAFTRPLASRQEPLSLALIVDDRPRHPDVFLHAVDTVIGVWYGVAGRRARVAVSSEELFHEDVQLVLTPKRVTTFRGALRKRPDLKVTAIVPPGSVTKMTATVHARDDAQPLRTVVFDEPSEILSALPAARLRVVLTVDGWEFEQEADLSDGLDGEAEFFLEPMVVSGRVSVAGDAVRANVAFQYGRTEVAAGTGEDGRYEVTLWQPGLYVTQVRVAEGGAAPFIDPTVEITGSRSLDFELPGNRITAVVTDADSGRPVDDAEIIVSSRSRHETFGEVTVGHRYTADDKGTFVLPPMKAGRVVITARASEYHEAKAELDVLDTTKSEVRLALRRLASAARLRVVLPGGLPAAAAEACIATPAGALKWRGAADADGALALPASDPADILVVRHPRAASALRRAAEAGETLHLQPAAPVPLQVRSVTASGEARPALLTLWIDGVRVTDSAMAFATWSRSALTNGTATWLGQNLPPRSLRVLATRRVMPPEIASGVYDAFANEIAYPWESAIVPAVVVE